MARIEVLGINGGDTIGVMIERRFQGNAGLACVPVRRLRILPSYPVRYGPRMRGRREHHGLSWALAAGAALALTALAPAATGARPAPGSMPSLPTPLAQPPIVGSPAPAQPPAAAPPPQPQPAPAPPDTQTTGTAPVPVPARVAAQHRERGNLVFDGIPPPDPALAATLERYQQSRGATFLDWQADGSLLDRDALRRERAGAPRRRTARHARAAHVLSPIPSSGRARPRSGAGIVFLKDQAGRRERPGATTSPPTVRCASSPTATSSTAARCGRTTASASPSTATSATWLSYDVYVADVSSAAAPQLLVGGRDDTWYPLDWSTDDSKLLVWKYLSITESYLYIADVATGGLTALEEHPVKAGIRIARFAPDGRGVYVLTDEDGEFAQLKFKDPVTHENRLITPDVPWDVEDFDVSADGRYIAYVLNEDGRSRLHRARHAEPSQSLQPGGCRRAASATRASTRAGTSSPCRSTARTPRAMCMSTTSRRASFDALDPQRSRTHRSGHARGSRAGALSDLGPRRRTPSGCCRPTSIRPRQAAGPCPVVIDIHGGPESQYRPEWDPFVQFLVNELGYAVVAPNVRGSSGYGKTFMALDNGVLREDAVRDIGSLLVWIGVQPGFDRDRVAVMGGSYGGYMALASLVDLRRAAARRHRPRRHQQLRHLPAQHVRLPARPAPRGVRRRAQRGDARVPRPHLAAHQRQPHPQAAAGGRRGQRSARAGVRVRPDRVARALERRRGLVPASPRTRATASGRSRTATPTC